MKKAYVPEAGDLVSLTFDPQPGREQTGRPALVLSPAIYNGRAGLALACPITTQIKGYPFEVLLPAGCRATGVVLADHIKTVEWKARLAERIDRCPLETFEDVRARLAPLIGC